MIKSYLWVRFIAHPTFAASYALLLLSSPAWAQSKILQYDDQGRVLSVDRYDTAPDAQNKRGGQDKGALGRPSDDPLTDIGDGPKPAPKPSPKYEPGEVLVLDPPAGMEGRVATLGFHVIENVTMENLDMRMLRLSTPRNMSVDDAIKLLSREFPGVTIDANSFFGASAGPVQKNPRTARMMADWQGISPTCGKGIQLGMIDSGVDLSHPALVAQNIVHRAFAKPGRTPGTDQHGTAIASMLAGKAEWGGLLPGAKLYSANMFEINEQGKMVGSAAALVKAMDWLASLKVDAVNLSIAGDDNKLVRRALDISDRAGLLLVASVGSWGNSSRRAFPASYSEVIAVTALKGRSMVYKYANTGPHIDFAAPGTGIWAAKPGGGGSLHYGTSFAVPYITATAAILKNAGRTANAAAFRKLLSRAVKDLGAPGRDDVFGYGALNVRPSCKN